MINRTQQYDPAATTRQEKHLRRWLMFSLLTMVLVVLALDLPNSGHPFEAWRWAAAAACWLIWVIADSIVKSKSVEFKGWLSIVTLVLEHALPLAVLFASLYLKQRQMTIYLWLFLAWSVSAILEWGKV